MSNLDASERQALELLTIAAHRAYMAALVDWERASHEADCPDCRCQDISAGDYRILCEDLAAETARRREIFTNLREELGFLPKPMLVKIPAEDRTCGRPR